MLEFKNVSYSYIEGTPVIHDLSFQIREGESIGLIGANGAGKSTIMKIIPGLIIPEGEVRIKGLRLTKKNLPEIRRIVGFVLQDSEQQMFMPTVKEDMIFGPMNYGITRAEAEEKAKKLMDRLGIIDLYERHNHRISGGEKRMAAIATILTMEPELLLFDEPSSSLDPKNRRRVINTINDLKQTKLISSHDLDFVWETCDRIILINHGVMVADGPKEEILRNKKLLETNDLELPYRFLTEE